MVATKKEKKSLDEYMEYYHAFCKEVGVEKAVVMMQVGSFYEVYSVLEPDGDDFRVVGCTDHISNILGLQVATIEAKSRPGGKYYRAGFPFDSIDMRASCIVDQGYHLRLYDQVLDEENDDIVIVGEKKKKTKKRKEHYLRETMTPGIISQTTSTSRYLLCVFLQSLMPKKVDASIAIRDYRFTAGISLIDCSTGHTLLSEESTKPENASYALDYLCSVVSTYQPKEILLYTHNTKKLEKRDFEEYFTQLFEGIPNTLHKDSLNPQFLRADYQNKVLETVFGNSGFMMSPIEQLGLSMRPTLLTSYVLLLDYVHSNNEHLLKQLPRPNVLSANNRLLLDNNTAEQLHLVPVQCTTMKKTRFRSVYDVINQCFTAMGKRELHHRIVSPITDKDELQDRYKTVQAFIDFTDKTPLKSMLKSIYDLERIHRHLYRHTLSPADFSKMILSYQQIVNIQTLLTKASSWFQPKLLREAIIEGLQAMVTESTKIFDFDKMRRCVRLGNSLHCAQTDYIKQGHVESVDLAYHKIRENEEKLQRIALGLSSLIEKHSNFVKVKYVNKEFVFETSTVKSSAIQLMKKNLGNPEKRKKISKELMDVLLNLSFKKTGKNEGNTRMTCNFTKNYPLIQTTLQRQLLDATREHYESVLRKYLTIYQGVFLPVVQFVKEMDTAFSLAEVAQRYRYSRPSIVEKETPYLIAKALRHPLIERNLTNVMYVPNDITIGTDHINGILLYGVNASGKSSLLRAIGVSVVLAQMGSYVPADSFEYSPFHDIFTRIAGGDNLLGGKSTFEIEMTELFGIFTRATPKSLVLTDELSHGTENISGSSLIGSAITELSAIGCKYIFSTHLHDLTEFADVKSIKDLAIYHFDVDCKPGCVVYNRALLPGNGDRVYGIEIAEALMPDQRRFIKRAYKNRNWLMKKSKHLVSTKCSRYNANKRVENKCELCGRKNDGVFDIHHIRGQCTANANGFIEHFHKNDLFNLVTLCKDCHINKVHYGTIELTGYQFTSQGVQLMWLDKTSSQ